MDRSDRDGRAETDSERRETYGVDRDRETGRRGSRGTDRPTVDPGEDTDASTSASAASSPDREPGPSPDPTAATGTDRPSAPDPTAVRRWAGLTLALAVLSTFTAAMIAVAYDAPTAAAGAAVLGLGFGAVAVVGRTVRPAVFGALDDAWAEHRPYVWFSAGLFAVGMGIGLALYAAGVDLTELLLEMITEEFGEEELPGDNGDLTGEIAFEPTATFFIQNNTPAFLVSIGGGLTLGAVTLLVMVFNGVLVGNVAAVVGAETGLTVIVALIGPHGIFELPALFIAAGVGFRFVHRLGQRVVGSRDALFTRAYLLRTALFVVFGWLLLVLAAFVEAYVTLLIADTLVPM